jgi:hypothetical protein
LPRVGRGWWIVDFPDARTASHRHPPPDPHRRQRATSPGHGRPPVRLSLAVSDASAIGTSTAEAARLRELLNRSGFLVFDDFGANGGGRRSARPSTRSCEPASPISWKPSRHASFTTSGGRTHLHSRSFNGAGRKGKFRSYSRGARPLRGGDVRRQNH